MFEPKELRSSLEQAISHFVDELMAVAELAAKQPPSRPARPRSRAAQRQPITQQPRPATHLGRTILRLIGNHPDGATVEQLTKLTGIGLGPLFGELQNLQGEKRIHRIARREDQLPVYVVSKAAKRDTKKGRRTG